MIGGDGHCPTRAPDVTLRLIAINTPMAPADRRDHDPVLAAARVALSARDAAGQDPFAAAWEQGQALTVEDIMTMVAAMRAEADQ